jgi:hypothetical protein
VAQFREDHELGAGNAAGEQLGVAQVHHGVGGTLQHQRACADARLPQQAGVPCARDGLGGPRAGDGRPAALEFDETVGESVLALAARRQGILHVAAQRNLGGHAALRRDQPQRGGGHGVGEGPARRGGHQNQGVNAPRVVDRQLLGHHAAQAHAHHVSPADPGPIEHGHDVSGHVGDIERGGRQPAAPASPVVHQHQPEMPPQLPQHRPPPGAVQSHPLDQDQPGPPPVQLPSQFVGDPQLTTAGIPRPAHVVAALSTLAIACKVYQAHVYPQ